MKACLNYLSGVFFRTSPASSGLEFKGADEKAIQLKKLLNGLILLVTPEGIEFKPNLV
jgi:hypothetical protein